MFVRLKGKLISFISSYAYLLVFIVLFFYSGESRSDKAFVMAIVSVLSLIWSVILYRRIRLIEDTGSTKLNTAAQGYAELEGKVAFYEGEVPRGLHLELPPMVWYRDFLKESGSGFILDDGFGRCTIDPHEAEVISPIYNYNDRFYNAIYPGETIYALGNLETLKKHYTEYEREGLIRSKLVEWKKDQSNFLDYFDKNVDGKIDEEEFEFAKEAAARIVDGEMEQSYQEPATHVVSTPNDGRPFILSSVHPDKLIDRYQRAMRVHLFAWAYLSILVLAM